MTPPAQALAQLNPEQQRAVVHGNEPLLIVAGAGTGKTTTLAHRVAHLIAGGVDPARILLLTFARRASAELLRRVDAILRSSGTSVGSGLNAAGRAETSAGMAGALTRVWGGTFHAIAARLLRLHGESIGMRPDFTICDRADSEDLLDVIRTELGLASQSEPNEVHVSDDGGKTSGKGRRFPRKGTCLEIYSRCLSGESSLEELLARAYPWCVEAAGDLKRLFAGYGDRKAEQSVLDYDDLLLFLSGLLEDPAAGDAVRRRFQCVLVDEYQDTNPVQARILRGLRPDGRGLTVVGDDAQAIYSFRGATVRNILDFSSQCPGTTVMKLEENYRSTPALLEATNRIVAQSEERIEKKLWSRRPSGEKPSLIHCQDEDEQTDFVVEKILAHREMGVPLRKQAVLFRTAHHSLALEVELSRRGIPFHKFGGLKFVEAAHIKDALAFLRLAENPRDLVAGTRLLMLLPGIGPRRARQLMDLLRSSPPGSRLAPWRALVAAPPSPMWADFVALLVELSPSPGAQTDTQALALPEQLARVRTFYTRIAETKYDNVTARLRDLEQLEHVAARYAERRDFLSELVLDPPASTQDLAGPPVLDEDYLILSTIHSAKGLEWDAVYVLHAADGNIPSDLATGNPAEIAEELRLFYVATSRARDFLYVHFPIRYYTRPGARSDRHTYAQLTRFLPPSVRSVFDERPARPPPPASAATAALVAELSTATGAAIRQKIRARWS